MNCLFMMAAFRQSALSDANRRQAIMTTETDLLPLPPLYIVPSVEPVDYPDVAQALMDYASANVAHATAPLQAEIEALRAEVERANSWNERVSVCRDHVADIVDGPC